MHIPVSLRAPWSAKQVLGQRENQGCYTMEPYFEKLKIEKWWPWRKEPKHSVSFNYKREVSIYHMIQAAKSE